MILCGRATNKSFQYWQGSPGALPRKWRHALAHCREQLLKVGEVSLEAATPVWLQARLLNAEDAAYFQQENLLTPVSKEALPSSSPLYVALDNPYCLTPVAREDNPFAVVNRELTPGETAVGILYNGIAYQVVAIHNQASSLINNPTVGE
jgi:hypothetical protein